MLAYFYYSFYKIYLVIVYYVVRSGLKAEKAEKGMKAVLQKNSRLWAGKFNFDKFSHTSSCCTISLIYVNFLQMIIDR